jgi:NitT/TauT family transport system ATP-binding protein
MDVMIAETGSTSTTVDAPPIVRLDHVGKIFSNGTVALAGLDLSVRRGEFLSLLGPSGCGKSTALRIIAGLAAPSSGDVRWLDGERGDATAAPDIGFVFQEPTLMPWATVFGNVWLPLRLKGQSRNQSRTAVMEAIDLVGLSPFAEAYPRELSGGMKMRVSIARALVTGSRLMLMDEPFAALDEITRFKLNNDILRLREQLGWTVIFVTHSVYESVYLSSRIAVMAARPGRVVAEFSVAAPAVRDETFRTTELYNRTCREVSSALHAAMGASDHL